jgi:hypothetical protein
LTSGPLFRPQINPHSKELAACGMNPATMYSVVEGYLQRLPSSVKAAPAAQGTTGRMNL